MPTLPEPHEYLQFLAPYPVELQELARAARVRLLEILPPVSEIVYDAVSAVSVGFSFTGKVADHFIHLPVYSKHMNIGFVKGTSLRDPESRLQGTGAGVRHLKLTSLSLLEDPYVLHLIDQSVALAVRPETPIEPISVVKVMNGTKRRPSPDQT